MPCGEDEPAELLSVPSGAEAAGGGRGRGVEGSGRAEADPPEDGLPQAAGDDEAGAPEPRDRDGKGSDVPCAEGERSVGEAVCPNEADHAKPAQPAGVPQ